VLPHNLHANGSLPGDDIRVIKGVHINQAFIFYQLLGLYIGLLKRIAVQDYPGTAASHRINFNLGRCPRHYNNGFDIHLRRRHCQTLGVITGRGSNHAPAALLLTEPDHFVIRPAQLEGENRLQILPL